MKRCSVHLSLPKSTAEAWRQRHAEGWQSLCKKWADWSHQHLSNLRNGPGILRLRKNDEKPGFCSESADEAHTDACCEQGPTLEQRHTKTVCHLCSYPFLRSIICSFVHLFIRSFIHSFIHSFLPSFVPSFIHSFIHSFIPSFLHSFIPSFLHSFIPSFLHSFIPSFVRSFVHSSIRSFIPSFLHSFIHSFLPSFIHSFIHSFIYLFKS